MRTNGSTLGLNNHMQKNKIQLDEKLYHATQKHENNNHTELQSFIEFKIKIKLYEHCYQIYNLL